jgi:inhibitor of cysteine peptidase
MQVDESANGGSVELAVGETLEIRLPENRMAGYRWQIEAAGQSVGSVAGDGYEAAAGPPGRGGTRVLTFKAERPGEDEIRLAYRRPWEENTPPAQTFALRVRVSA